MLIVQMVVFYVFCVNVESLNCGVSLTMRHNTKLHNCKLLIYYNSLMSNIYLLIIVPLFHHHGVRVVAHYY